MQRSRPPLPVLLIACVIALAALWTFSGSSSGPQPSEASVPAEAARPPTLVVEGFRVREEALRTTVDVSGVLAPAREVVVGAEVGGRVTEIAAAEHSHVDEGDPLVQIDTALPRATEARARASLLQAEAGQRLAHAELERQQRLSDRGVASPAELERALSEDQRSRARVAEARAALGEARARLGKTRIRAPFSAFVSSLELEPGAYLRPGDPVARLVDLSEIELRVGVDDRQILAMSERDSVKVSVDVLPGEWFEGYVAGVGRAPDPNTRKYPVPVRVPNPEERLLPGMLGMVRFELGEAKRAIRIPRRALRREFELDFLFVLEPESAGIAVARRRRVRGRPIAFRPDLLQVNAGLDAGELIAISAVRQLRDGQRVQVRQGEPGLFP